jgi:hypothetical protein
MWRALMILLVATAAAEAKKPPPPTKAQLAAIQLASDWLAAPNSPKLTGKPFFTVVYGEAGKVECNAAACLKDKLAAKGKPHLWKRNLGGPLAAAKLKILDDKAAIVVELDEGCDGTENQTLIVVKNKKVTAVLAQTAACSE